MIATIVRNKHCVDILDMATSTFDNMPLWTLQRLANANIDPSSASSGTLPPPISKYASISKYFEVLRHRSFFDIEVQHFDIQHFDIVVQHFDIEASKKLRYRNVFDVEAACFDIGCQNLRASISKCMYFDIDI
jgi:hypothetical protein